MHLQPGYYTIHNGDNLVGRSFAEDLSLNPKTVFNATTDTESIWQIDSLPDGKYILRNFEAPVTAIDGHVKAVIYPNINEHLKVFEWHVTPRHHQGKHLYTIATPNGDGFWHTTSDGFSPIAVGHISVGTSDPPFFTKSALFRIEPVTLRSGVYTIHNGSSPVGRASFEDFSLKPKPIFNATDAARSLWYIHAEKNGKYKLFNLGGSVAAIKDRLFAFIQHDLDRSSSGLLNHSFIKEDSYTRSRGLAMMDGSRLPTSFLRIVPSVLRSGFYKIRNRDHLVGRAFIEDQSLGPKPILNKTDNPHATWFIQNIGPNRYKLSASQGFDVESLDFTSEKFRGYDPVAAEKQDDESALSVFAFLEPKFTGFHWLITPRFEYGEDVYTSWCAHEKEKSQIEIKNVLFENPIPPNLLFKIDPLAVPIREAL
ncbi:hypothetical protein Clacol_002192 [Clathrus columnatus]|uniref:Uncharacterized protein n=1 Tax=Clathrus columnatus TaxID=1419009 RepID=A0AAV5A4P0_9AGAM|nr:hypothetical protein Clacol_002192 [Clathrus columnatus]